MRWKDCLRGHNYSSTQTSQTFPRKRSYGSLASLGMTIPLTLQTEIDPPR